MKALLLNLKPKAIMFGVLVDVVGSVMVGLFMGLLLVLISLAHGHVSHDSIEAIRSTTYSRIGGLLGATVSTVLAGFVTGRMSRPNGLINSIALGCVSICLALALAAAMPSATPIWKLVAGCVLTIPAAALGGWLGNGPKRKGQTSPPG